MELFLMFLKNQIDYHYTKVGGGILVPVLIGLYLD